MNKKVDKKDVIDMFNKYYNKNNKNIIDSAKCTRPLKPIKKN